MKDILRKMQQQERNGRVMEWCLNVYEEWRTAGCEGVQRTVKMLLTVLLFCIALTGITMYTAPERHPAASGRAGSAGAEADMSFVTDMAGTVAGASGKDGYIRDTGDCSGCYTGGR